MAGLEEWPSSTEFGLQARLHESLHRVAPAFLTEDRGHPLFAKEFFTRRETESNEGICYFCAAIMPTYNGEILTAAAMKSDARRVDGHR
jgi:hypothetical protein